MNFLTLLLQATPHISATPPVQEYDTWGMPWWGVALIFAGVAALIFFFWKKGMIGYGTGAVPKGTVHKADPPQ